MEDFLQDDNDAIKMPPKGLAIFALVGPSLVWCAEYIGSGEVILATRTGSILGTSVLWAVVIGVFLKSWIGLSGARYTVCTGEGMIDMFDRVPGPSHWMVWIVLAVQIIAGTLAIGSLATAAGVFLNSLVPISADLGGWLITIFAVMVVWSGMFNVLKIVMSILVLIIILGVVYVTIHVFPGTSELLKGLGFQVPAVPEWALSYEGITDNPWREVLPLIGWGAGGFASQVWYSYWVLGAGYGACKGRSYGQAADLTMLQKMDRTQAQRIKGWCRVLYVDAVLAMIIGIAITCCFLIAGAGILRPQQLAPEGPDVALTLSQIFSLRWEEMGGKLFLLSGSAALISTQVGQLAGWPRLLADSFRICLPKISSRFSWRIQFRFFLLFFFCTNMIIVYVMKYKPVVMVKLSAVLDGLLLTPLQALVIAVVLFFVMPKMLSQEAARVLKPHGVFAVGLVIAVLVFGYFCVFQIPYSF